MRRIISTASTAAKPRRTPQVRTRRTIPTVAAVGVRLRRAHTEELGAAVLTGVQACEARVAAVDILNNKPCQATAQGRKDINGPRRSNLASSVHNVVVHNMPAFWSVQQLCVLVTSVVEEGTTLLSVVPQRVLAIILDLHVDRTFIDGVKRRPKMRQWAATR